jgi:hypothetical protein
MEMGSDLGENGIIIAYVFARTFIYLSNKAHPILYCISPFVFPAIGVWVKKLDSEMIKGVSKNDGFEKLFVWAGSDGWVASTWEISKNCNKIVITTPVEHARLTAVMTLKRK